MLRKWDIDDCDIEIVKVYLKQSEYDEKVVRLVKTLLEIDELTNQVDDTAIIKEAA